MGRPDRETCNHPGEKGLNQRGGVVGEDVSAFCTFFFFFLGLHLRHTDVPRLGIELELQVLAYATVTAMPDLSPVCDLHHSSRQCWILY